MSCIKDFTVEEFSNLMRKISNNECVIYRGVDTSNDINQDGEILMNSFIETVDKEWFFNQLLLICIISNPKEFFTTLKEAEDYIKKKTI